MGTLFQEFLQEPLEQEMIRALVADPRRTHPGSGQLPCRPLPRSLAICVGRLELQMPRDRGFLVLITPEFGVV